MEYSIVLIMTAELKILSFNVGLTRLKFIPFNYNLVPLVADRAKLIPAALATEVADVVCLQEVFENRLFKQLRAELKDIYPYAYHNNSGWKLFNKGLAIFSKHKFEHIDEVGFKTLGIEKFAQKGASLIRFVQGPHAGLVVANVHFPYGGYVGSAPAFAPIVALRDRAIEHLHQTLDKIGQLVVMAGDFNFGPTMAEQNYEYLLSLGYANLTSEKITWDPENTMNKFFTLMRPHSLDHIFANIGLSKRISAFRSRVLFNEPMMSAKGKEAYLSDHYGVMVTVRYSAVAA